MRAWPNAPRSSSRRPRRRQCYAPAPAAAPRAAPVGECRACGARRDRRGRRNAAAGPDPAGVLRRRHGPPDRAEADACSRIMARVPAIEPEQPATPETFIPQAAERAPLRAPADAEIRGTPDAGPGRDPAGPRRRRGRSSAEVQAVAAAAARQCRPRPPRRRDRAADRGPRRRTCDGRRCPERKPQRTVAQQMAANQDPVSEYAKRPAPQGLDVHGRPAPVAAAPQGDDHLDIPAFLRRQAN